MFLSNKSLRKIGIMAICYFLLGSVLVASWVAFHHMGVNEKFLLILGIIVYLLCVLVIFTGRYAEGKGKLINLGNKLVRNELKPAEFINCYESVRNSNDLIVCKPSMEILQLVVLAYDLLDDEEKALATADEMIAVASDKKKAFAGLLKVSLLFGYDKKEEAEMLFNEIQKQKLDIVAASLVDAIFKSDRAMAMGDYKTVEAYNLQLLARKFPKLDNAGKLVVHYKLGEVYERLHEEDKALNHYRYCVDFGGETAIRAFAAKKITPKG